MEKLLRLVKSAWGRFLSGLTAALTLLWMTHPEYTGQIDWEPTIAFALAALAWAYSCLPNDQPAGQTQTAHVATDHDRKLFAAFNAQMPPAEVSFLRGHDFGGSFSISSLGGLRAICMEWQGAAYEFDDPEVQEPFEYLLVKMRHLSSRTALNTQMISADAAMVPRGHVDGWEAVAQELNDKADEVADSIDQFVRFARKRLA